MRIHRIAIRNFRGVQQADIALDPTGVTIIEGDNEVGKSSVADAVRLILEETDSSKKARIRALQPVGRDVGPEVTLEFSTGPYRLVYAKRWLKRPSTELTILEPERVQLTGRDAHDRVDAILDETLDRGLWQALRLEQGGGLNQASFALPSLGRALDLAAGGDLTGDREDALWDRISAERDQYFTATWRPRGLRVDLAERLVAAEERAAAATAAIAVLDQQVVEAARLATETTELAARQEGLERAAADLRSRAQVVATLRAEREQLASRHQVAASEHEKWCSVAERRLELAGRLTRSRDRLAAAERAVSQAAPARAAAEAHHRDAIAAHDADLAAVVEAEAVHLRASRDSEHRRQEIEVAQLRERHERVVTDEEALRVAAAVLDGAHVDGPLLARIEQAELEVVRAEAAAEAGAASVSISALAPTKVEIDGVAVALAEGDAHEVRLTSSTDLVVPGVVSLSIQAGAEDRARAERVLAARAELAHLCATAGVADLAQARRVAAARAEAERTTQEAAARIRDNLRDLTIEALAQKAERLATKVAGYASERAPEPSIPADHDLAQAAAREAEAALGACRARQAEAAAAITARATERNAAEIDDKGLATTVEHEAATLAGDLAALERDQAQLSDDALATALTGAEAARGEATRALASAESALAAEDPESLDAQVTNAAEARQRGADAIARNRLAIQRVQLGLEHDGEKGLARELDDALTARDHLQRALAAIEARAAAARLLYETFDARRSETRNRYLAPFRERIERFGRIVFGQSLEIELDADLRIERRTVDGTTVEFDQLSTGAREQLGLLARLACASIVSSDGGAPVVFDDALGWTDPGRLPQMGAAIALAGRECQIIVLTCTPGRFAGVGAATTIRMAGPPRMTIVDGLSAS